MACSIILIACGGSYSNSTTPITSGLTNRAFVSNQFTSAIDIVNASTDKLSTHRIITDSGPTVMSLSPSKLATLVFTGGTNALDVLDNKNESVAGSLQLPGASESFFFLPDNTHVFVAVRNSGNVIPWDTSSTTPPVPLTVPNARWLAESNDGHWVLAFPDDNSNTVYAIDTTQSTLTVSPIAGFDHPVFAVFSSDNSVAYVLNCGPECGGTTASVQVVNFPAKTLGANMAVPGGATHAVLNSGTLYIAGTPQPAPACVNNVNAPSCGRLSVMSVSGGTLNAPSATYEIADGFHDHMLMGPVNRLFIGSQFTCTAVRPSGNGCLSIFNTSGNSVATPIVCGSACNGLADVTGMAVIPHRTNIVYVVEGGEVHVYDASTDAQVPGLTLDTAGLSWDVVAPD